MTTIVLKLQVLTFTLLLYTSVSAAKSTYTTATDKLFTSLTYGYEANNRPNENVAISVSLSVSSFNSLDLLTGKFSITGWFSVSWTDSSYEWNPSIYTPEYIQYLFLPTGYCWKPQLILDNSAIEMNIHNEDVRQMRVDFNGNVLWEPAGVFTAQCDVDVTNFPFDTLSDCYLSMSSWVYNNTEVTISHGSDVINLDYHLDQSEWKVLKTSTETKYILGGSGDLSKTFLRFKFTMKRHNTYYVWVLLVPYILISSLGLVVFLLPAVKGEKVSFSVTILLLVAIFYLIFSTVIPSSTETFPVIGIYFFLLMLANILELLVTTIVVRLHKNGRDELPVSERLQAYAKTCLATLACYSCDTRNIGGYNDNRHYTRRFPMPKNTRVSPASLPINNSSPASLPINNSSLLISPISHSENHAMRPKNAHHEFDRIRSAASTRTASEIDTLSTDFSNVSSSAQLQIPDFEYTWTDIADMVERLCFVFFLLIRLLISIVFLALLNTAIG